MALARMLSGSMDALNAIWRSWRACWRGVKYRLPTSNDVCSWNIEGVHSSIVTSVDSLRNISWMAHTDAIASSNLGDESPVSIMDCRMYGRLLCWLVDMSNGVLITIVNDLHFEWLLYWRQIAIAYDSLNTENDLLSFLVSLFPGTKLQVLTSCHGHRLAEILDTIILETCC